MPLHFDSITRDPRNPALLAALLQEVNNCDTTAASSDKQYLHLGKDFFDIESREKIGRFVFTLRINNEQQSLDILDLDITLSGSRTVELRFLKLLPGSSGANEYYDAETADDEQHLQVETVNRHVIDGDIVNTVHAVCVSAFPFSLSVYDNMDAFNAWVGFKEEIPLKGTEYKIGGLSQRFISPGNAINPNIEEDETYSFVVGTVTDFRDVSVMVGDVRLSFVVAQLDTALGILPTAMSRKVFDLDKLAVGKVVVMKADIKADFAL